MKIQLMKTSYLIRIQVISFKINDCDIIKAVGDNMTPITQDGDLCIIKRNNGSVKNGKIMQ